MIRCILAALLATALFAPLAQAEKKDDVVCRAGTVNLLVGGKEATVLSLEMTGVSPATSQTSRCVGVIRIIGGKRKSNGYCKIMDTDGDFQIEEWTGSGKPGEGTWEFTYGTGKWKGITGSGNYVTAVRGKPIAKGTFQSCYRVTGTYNVPK